MITCFYHRRIIKSSLDTGGTLPARAREHLQKCPDCRKIYEMETGVVRALRDTAGAGESSPSPFLHARIMSAIARSEGTAEVKHSARQSVWAIGLATACLLLLSVLWMLQHGVPSHPTITHATRPTAVPLDLSLGVKLPDGNQLRQWTGKLDEPLETEMKLVVGDAKTAINSLANNFLPEKVRQSLFEQDKGS